MTSSYRFDHRSKEEFAKEIKEYTFEERRLLELWLTLIEKQTGKKPAFKDIGCGNSGELLKDSEVSSAPDFDVDGYGLIEVKFSKPLIKENFHLKVSQVNQYLKKGNVTILMVNGSDGIIPEFTLLFEENLKQIKKFCEKVPFYGFGGKIAFKIPIKLFEWTPLSI